MTIFFELIRDNILSYIFCLFGYISNNNLFPEPLSKSKEEYYLRRYFEGDKEAKDILIEHNLRLVAHIAKKYAKNEQDDLSEAEKKAIAAVVKILKEE